jgi:hypothetical protein
MSDHPGYWCHDCQVEVIYWSEFLEHANAGHAIQVGAPEGENAR